MDAGNCKEKCGDGYKLSNLIECDDGNTESGEVDGCDENCNIEPGWECYVNDERKSICSKTLPFKASLEIQPSDDDNINIQMEFNKPFDSTNWKGIENYIDFGVEDKNIEDLFDIKVIKGTLI